MRNLVRNNIFLAVAVAAGVALPGGVSGAETVYKCVKDGKALYTANPRSADGECQETKIEKQRPEDFARAIEEKRQRLEEERIADEQRLREREVRAKEQEAAASARRAKALEEQLLFQRQAPQATYPETYPAYQWWGWNRPVRPLPPSGGWGRPPSQHPPPTPSRPPPGSIQTRPGR